MFISCNNIYKHKQADKHVYSNFFSGHQVMAVRSWLSHCLNHFCPFGYVLNIQATYRFLTYIFYLVQMIFSSLLVNKKKAGYELMQYYLALNVGIVASETKYLPHLSFCWWWWRCTLWGLDVYLSTHWITVGFLHFITKQTAAQSHICISNYIPDPPLYRICQLVCTNLNLWSRGNQEYSRDADIIRRPCWRRYTTKSYSISSAPRILLNQLQAPYKSNRCLNYYVYC